MTYRTYTATQKTIAKSLTISESELKRESQNFKQAYVLKLEFSINGSPSEVLNILQNKKERKNWDIDLNSIDQNHKENTLILSYKPADKNFPSYLEDVKIEFMMHNSKYYIFETVKSSVLGDFKRAWIFKSIGPNSLYKVTFLSQVSHVYHRSKDNCRSLIGSISALRNTLQMTEREQDDKYLVGSTGINDDLRTTFQAN